MQRVIAHRREAGKGRGKPTTGNAYATTQHDRRPSSSRAANLKASVQGCNESVSKRNNLFGRSSRGSRGSVLVETVLIVDGGELQSGSRLPRGHCVLKL